MHAHLFPTVWGPTTRSRNREISLCWQGARLRTRASLTSLLVAEHRCFLDGTQGSTVGLLAVENSSERVCETDYTKPESFAVALVQHQTPSLVKFAVRGW